MQTPQVRDIAIYPPWASFSFSWATLKDALKNPTRLEEPTTDLRGLRDKYSFSVEDCDVLDGAEGGGILLLRRTLSFWLPMGMFIRETNLHPIPGFGWAKPTNIFILVPKITPEQKLGMCPYLAAPSPHFSIEVLPELDAFYIMITPPDTANLFLQIIGYFGITGSAFLQSPEALVDRLLPLRIQKPGASWLRMEKGLCDFDAFISFIVYSGLALRSKAEAHVLQVFAPSQIAKGWEFSASRWPKKLANIRRNVDW